MNFPNFRDFGLKNYKRQNKLTEVCLESLAQLLTVLIQLHTLFEAASTIVWVKVP